MQNDIDAYNKTHAKPKISVRMNPYFTVSRKTAKKSRKSGKTTSKMFIAEMVKRVEEYDLINILAQAQPVLP